MNREFDTDDMIDLGSVTEETKGTGVILDDQHGAHLSSVGLSDD
jgi:hypothetical protein